MQLPSPHGDPWREVEGGKKSCYPSPKAGPSPKSGHFPKAGHPQRTSPLTAATVQPGPLALLEPWFRETERA